MIPFQAVSWVCASNRTLAIQVLVVEFAEGKHTDMVALLLGDPFLYLSTSTKIIFSSFH